MSPKFEEVDYWKAIVLYGLNQATLGINYFNQYVYLFLPFDPTRTIGSARLPANSEYRYNQLNLTYTSNNSTTITTNATATLGEFFNGKIYSIGGTANLRIMPKALISLNVNFDRIELPESIQYVQYFIIKPKI